MIPRPHFRLPIWAAIAIVAVAYVLRALAIKGGDFTPEMPQDAIVLVVLVVALPLVAWARTASPTRPVDPDVGPADESSRRAD